MRKKKFYRQVVYDHPEGVFPLLREPKQFSDWLDSLRHGRPLVLELGAGTGDFLVRQAARIPDQFFLAVESKPDRLYLGFKKSKELNIQNIAFLQADIKHLGRYGLPLVESIYLLFSDPWPKSRHHIRRLSSERFLPIYQDLLKPDGDLILKTDSQMLFDYSVETLTSHHWELEEVVNDFHTPDEEQTAYERKFRQLQKNIWYLKAHPPSNVD